MTDAANVRPRVRGRRSRPPRRRGRRLAGRRARPLQRATRCARRCSTLRREPDGSSSTSSEVKFIDSTALGVLIEARTRMADRSGFLLAAPGLETRRALEVSGLDRHFAVHDSLADALEAAQSESAVTRVPAPDPRRSRRYADAIVKASLGDRAGRHARRPGRAGAPRAARRRRRIRVPRRRAIRRRGHPSTRSCCGRGCCTAATTRSARCRRGRAAACRRSQARAALSPTSPARARPATSTASRPSGSAPTTRALAKQLGFLQRAQLDLRARWIDRRLADRPLGRPGLPGARAAAGEAPPRRRPPLVLPPHRRGRQGHERLGQAPAYAQPPLGRG